MHASSYDEMRRNLTRFLGARAGEPLTLLDVGAQQVPDGFRHSYRELMPPAWRYVGTDLAKGKNVDVVMHGPYTLAAASDSFDVVISGQCLEHCENPFQLTAEMVRVLKPGGLILLTAPWQWREHKWPLDCWRILPDGMRALLMTSGVEPIEAYMRDYDCWGVGKRPGDGSVANDPVSMTVGAASQ